MKAKKQTKAYVCLSADWNWLIDSAESPMEAAATAVNRQMNLSPEVFSIGSAIEVIPVKLSRKDAEFIYSPFVLADMGMHQFAKELAGRIEKSREDGV